MDYQKKGDEAEKISVLIMAQNFPKLMTETKPHIQVAQIQEYRSCRFIKQINMKTKNYRGLPILCSI